LSGLTPSTLYHYRVRSKDAAGNLAVSSDQSFTTGAGGTTVYLSDLSPVGTPVNGWGPYERDMSNGEQAAGDGHTLTIGSTTYAKGLGVHALSDLSFAVPAGCTTFVSDIGIDAEVGANGSVNFAVWNGTASRLSQSTTRTGGLAPITVTQSLAGVSTLRLVVNPVGPNNNFDHSDWANARFLCN
jgi:hypothetical protein